MVPHSCRTKSKGKLQHIEDGKENTYEHFTIVLDFLAAVVKTTI